MFWKVRKIRIGTRRSRLALWQANQVSLALSGIAETEIVEISSAGDKDRSRPIHQIGTGVFTKALDDALLNEECDIAVHSLKDYPTRPPKGLKLISVLERDYFRDLFIPGPSYEPEKEMLILSGSPRRMAQWKRQYPHHCFENLRGNMETRLQKIEAADGGILSEAGLRRLSLVPEKSEWLDWMIPAPAQGVMAVIGRDYFGTIESMAAKINHEPTMLCAMVEREFLHEIEGGCAAPVGALATIEGDNMQMVVNLCSPDGTNSITEQMQRPLSDWKAIGKKLAWKVLNKGGYGIMRKLRKNEG